MRTSIKNKLSKISGFIFFLLALPLMIVLRIIESAAEPVQDLLYRFRDSLNSLTDPAYVPPIGLGGFYAMQDYWRKAVRAEADRQNSEAMKYWKKCAALYNTNAMLHIVRHCESPGSGMPDLKLAAEFCALAAGYGNPEGEVKYVSLTGHELSGREMNRVKEAFIKTRRTWLQD